MPGTQLATPRCGIKCAAGVGHAHGNVLLRGWTVSDVPFCITELAEYLVADMVRGPGPDVVHVASAFTYTLPVLLVNFAACLPRVTRRRQVKRGYRTRLGRRSQSSRETP